MIRIERELFAKNTQSLSGEKPSTRSGRPSSESKAVSRRPSNSGPSAAHTLEIPRISKTHAIRCPVFDASMVEGNGEARTSSIEKSSPANPVPATTEQPEEKPIQPPKTANLDRVPS